MLPHLIFSFRNPKSVILILNYLHLQFSSVYSSNPQINLKLRFQSSFRCICCVCTFSEYYPCHVNYVDYLSFADWSCYLLSVFERRFENLWELNASVFPDRGSEDEPLKSWKKIETSTVGWSKCDTSAHYIANLVP